MGRKRRLILGTTPIGGKSMRSRKVARIVTAQYHKLRNEANSVEHSVLPTSDKAVLMSAIEAQMEQIGGIEAYQQASVISTQYFKTSKWVVKMLASLFPNKREKLRTLEVGAINPQLLQHPRLSVRAIDINSQHPLIEECDFFTIPPMQDYDVVVCSMVVNFVSEPEKRVEMLARLLAHLKPDTGALFLVLPLRCVNSPLVGLSRFESLLTGLGGEFLLPARQTPKLIFHTLRYKSREGGSESAGAVSDWESRIRSHAASVMDKETSDFFTQCSPDVVPGRFSLRLPPSLCQ